jgi:rRNA-processing protein FCF1
MKKVIIDTNALMAITEFKMDIFSELEKTCYFNYQLFILSGTIDELNKIISEQRGKYKRASQLALTILKIKKVNIIESSGDVDENLVQLSKKGDVVLTQDIGLKRRLTKPYLTIRQKKKIVIVE